MIMKNYLTHDRQLAYIRCNGETEDFPVTQGGNFVDQGEGQIKIYTIFFEDILMGMCLM